MSKGIGASIGASVEGDRETRALVLWILFGAIAVAAIGLVAIVALIASPASRPYEFAALPLLDAAPPPAAEPLSNPSADAPEQPPSPLASPDSGVSQEPGSEAVPPVPFAQTPPAGAVRPPLKREAARPSEGAPLPPPRPAGLGAPARPAAARPLAPALARASGNDRWTAVYDISAHAVYLPDGERLEAHSGLGDRLDDPRYASEADRGPTPPHLYGLTPREELFHGVQALRLDPIGDGDTFGRTGLLAHSYMLGPKGDSNGCVSFKDYDAFLRAYENGQVKRLAVVARLD